MPALSLEAAIPETIGADETGGWIKAVLEPGRGRERHMQSALANLKRAAGFIPAVRKGKRRLAPTRTTPAQPQTKGSFIFFESR